MGPEDVDCPQRFPPSGNVVHAHESSCRDGNSYPFWDLWSRALLGMRDADVGWMSTPTGFTTCDGVLN